jgi:hypothetical protein
MGGSPGSTTWTPPIGWPATTQRHDTVGVDVNDDLEGVPEAGGMSLERPWPFILG